MLLKLMEHYASWSEHLVRRHRMCLANHGLEAWRTASPRTGPSVPARYLKEKGLLVGRLLDYGCGRGQDVKEYHMCGYDPHWSPDPKVLVRGRYHTITCSYVLNVVHEDMQPLVIKDIINLLAPGGKAYFTVRRDIKERRMTRPTTLQRPVYLALPTLVDDTKFCIYEKTRY
jgi:hypothetical protein